MFFAQFRLNLRRSALLFAFLAVCQPNIEAGAKASTGVGKVASTEGQSEGKRTEEKGGFWRSIKKSPKRALSNLSRLASWYWGDLDDESLSVPRYLTIFARRMVFCAAAMLGGATCLHHLYDYWSRLPVLTTEFGYDDIDHAVLGKVKPLPAAMSKFAQEGLNGQFEVVRLPCPDQILRGRTNACGPHVISMIHAIEQATAENNLNSKRILGLAEEFLQSLEGDFGKDGKRKGWRQDWDSGGFLPLLDTTQHDAICAVVLGQSGHGVTAGLDVTEIFCRGDGITSAETMIGAFTSAAPGVGGNAYEYIQNKIRQGRNVNFVLNVANSHWVGFSLVPRQSERPLLLFYDSCSGGRSSYGNALSLVNNLVQRQGLVAQNNDQGSR